MKYLRLNEQFVYLWKEVPKIQEIVNDLLAYLSDDYKINVYENRNTPNEIIINITSELGPTNWIDVKDNVLSLSDVFGDYYNENDDIMFSFLIDYDNRSGWETKVVNVNELQQLSDDFYFKYLLIRLIFNKIYKQ